jgi:glycosyltransferase involved in cell wall biosynthesis
VHILIDTSCLMKELTGIGVYTRNLLQALIPLDTAVDYTLFMNALKGPTPEGSLLSNQNVHVIRRHIPGKLLLELWTHCTWPKIEKLTGKGRFDLFHSPNFLYQPSNTKRVVTTVHDLAFVKKQTYGSRYSGKFHRETLERNLHRADKIIVVTHAVKRDLNTLYSISQEKIRVIHHGLDPRFRQSDDLAETKVLLKRAGYPEHYILSVGTIEPRKNFPILIKAFSSLVKLRPELHLVIAGRYAENLKEIERTIRRLHLEDKVIMPGYIGMEVLIGLYKAADLAVFPSWEEGFGFPPLEAAACGVPVIASDIPAHREVLGDAVEYFKPHEDLELKNRLVQLIENEELKEELRLKGLKKAELYSWAEAARQHLDVYREVLNDQNSL